MTELFKEIIEINAHIPDDIQKVVPVLIGSTGVGKTTRIRKFAEEHNMPVKTLLLGTMLEEDVGGLPYIVDGVTHYSLPEWAASKEPFVLFLDELDKARPSVISTVLTVLAEHRLRDHKLPEGTIIICAQQPVSPSEFLADQTGQAFAARSCYVDLQESWGFLENKYSIDLNFLPKGERHASPILTRPAPRQIEWAVNAVQYCLNKDGENGENLAERILAGMLQPQLIKPLIEAVKNNNALTPEAIVDAVTENNALIAELSIPELCNLLPDFWLHSNVDTVCAVWETILLKGTNEEIGAGLASQYEKLLAVAEANGGEVEVLGETTEAEDEIIAEKFNAMLSRCGKEWIARYEAEKKSKAA